MYVSTTLWIMTQVPPCEAVVMFKAMVFLASCPNAKRIAVFSKDRLCQLPSSFAG